MLRGVHGAKGGFLKQQSQHARASRGCPISDDEWMSGPESQTQLRATTASKHGAKLKNQKRICQDTY